MVIYLMSPLAIPSIEIHEKKYTEKELCITARNFFL